MLKQQGQQTIYSRELTTIYNIKITVSSKITNISNFDNLNLKLKKNMTHAVKKKTSIIS